MLNNVMGKNNFVPRRPDQIAQNKIVRIVISGGGDAANFI